ncbi:MAG TPA: DUF72 domain-containing protein [Actinomycetota bacterium]|nr:DUF72 domain-containing protein [Actinomycetota bacterium]
MGAVLVGTASWTDKTLIDSHAFYPPEATSADARLRYYASQFPIVEVDSTYYFPPTERNAALWAQRTPVEFTFHIKAYSLLTRHPTRRQSLPEELRPPADEGEGKKGKGSPFVYASHLPAEALDEVWRQFREALMPLHSAGKLGVVHFQFPEWFLPGAESRDYLLECAGRLPDYQIAVEFRNATWVNERNRERTLGLLREHHLPFTCVDMPQGFRSSLPPMAEATSSALAYVRFHGRNTEAWEATHATATPRFAYLYSQDELAGWVPRIQALAGQAREVHVLMNNCYRDNAQVNARQLVDLLR